MHHPQVGGKPGFAELLRLVGGLAAPEQRKESADSLARLLGGGELLFFAPDPELGVLLPALGLPQVLRRASEWRRFLDDCTREGTLSGSVPGPEGEPIPARGLALPDGTVAVLIAPAEDTVGPESLRPLLPLLGALFRAERQVGADEARARAAADAAERAQVLTHALQELRQRLEDALTEAQQARTEARQRAEQAEELAVELQGQAMKLEMLNDELVSRTEDAERARASADAANRAKSEFLANMSHELRTPINAVIGYTELLHMGITGPITDEQRVQLDRIRASSMHLLSLVNDVLDLAKVEAGRMTIRCRREPAAEVVAEAAALVEIEAAARELTLENQCRDPDATYVGDRDRVRQILANLLSNAVKFTQPGGRVTIRGRITEQAETDAQVVGAGPWLQISVEDTGIGMDADQISRIFQPFVQADSGRTRAHGGTGLGLTISRQLARLMGGDLTLRSEKGTGSCFTLWLPAVSAQRGSLDPTIRVGTLAAAEPYPAGLDEVGAALRAQLPAITTRYVQRVRAELPDELLASMDDSEILDLAPVFVADLAGVLSKLGRLGGDPLLLRDGSDVQRLLAERHGADRGRRDWDAAALRQEFDVLRDEIVSVVRGAAETTPDVDVAGAIDVIGRLVETAHRTSLRSHGAALGGAGSSESA